MADLGVHRASITRVTWRWTPLDSEIGLPLISIFTADFGMLERQRVCGTGYVWNSKSRQILSRGQILF